MKKLLVFSVLLLALNATAQVAVNDGNWATDATWNSGTSPGFTNLGSIVIDAYVISNSGITFEDVNARTLDVLDTLIVYGNVTFSATKNNASLNIGANNLVVIYGDLSVGKNSAGINVASGGVLVVTGTISATGTEGTSDISGAGKVYTNNPTGLDDANISEGSVQTIDDLSGDGYTEIEDFVNSGGSDPLPVELLYFNASAEQNVVLSWATATEINNDYFSVQRSEDGENFYEIAKVQGQGNTSSIVEYSYTDRHTIAPVEYYRLKQVDFDGQFEYFEIKRVSTDAKKFDTKMTVFPTRIKAETVSITLNRPAEIKDIRIVSLSGGTVKDLNHNLSKSGQLNYTLDSNDFTKGLYLLHVTTSEGNQLSSRIIVE